MKFIALLAGPEVSGVFPWKSTAYPMWDESDVIFVTAPRAQPTQRSNACYPK